MNEQDVKAVIDVVKSLEKDDDANMTSYMYISKKRVVGLLMVKRIQRAYELLPPNKEEEKSKGNASISRSLKSSKALLGIHQIWVQMYVYI